MGVCDDEAAPSRGSTLAFFLNGLTVTVVGSSLHCGGSFNPPEMVLTVGQGEMSLTESFRQSLSLDEIKPGEVLIPAVRRPATPKPYSGYVCLRLPPDVNARVHTFGHQFGRTNSHR